MHFIFVYSSLVDSRYNISGLSSSSGVRWWQHCTDDTPWVGLGFEEKFSPNKFKVFTYIERGEFRIPIHSSWSFNIQGNTIFYPPLTWFLILLFLLSCIKLSFLLPSTRMRMREWVYPFVDARPSTDIYQQRQAVDQPCCWPPSTKLAGRPVERLVDTWPVPSLVECPLGRSVIRSMILTVRSIRLKLKYSNQVLPKDALGQSSLWIEV